MISYLEVKILYLDKAFTNEIKQEFEMSMFGEIKFFIGFQVY